MSWNKAYSIFPRSTFIQYNGFKLEAKDSRSCFSPGEKTFAGWNLQELVWLEEQPLNHPIRKYRRVGDGFSWTIPFNTKNVQWSKIPDYVLEYQSFKMNPLAGFFDGVVRPVAYQTVATEFMDETLSYRYLCNRDLFRFLNQHFGSAVPTEPHDTELTARQIYPACTKGNHEGSSLNRVGDPEKTKPRTSRDAEFPDWYRKWERLSGDGNGFPKFRKGPLEGW